MVRMYHNRIKLIFGEMCRGVVVSITHHPGPTGARKLKLTKNGKQLKEWQLLDAYKQGNGASR